MQSEDSILSESYEPINDPVSTKLEPTPDNYARAYAQESGEKAPGGDDGAALATLIGKLVRGVERGGRHWTAERRKDSLQRVLEGSRSDAKRLQQRLTQLAASWDSDSPDGAVETEPSHRSHRRHAFRIDHCFTDFCEGFAGRPAPHDL